MAQYKDYRHSHLPISHCCPYKASPCTSQLPPSAVKALLFPLLFIAPINQNPPPPPTYSQLTHPFLSSHQHPSEPKCHPEDRGTTFFQNTGAFNHHIVQKLIPRAVTDKEVLTARLQCAFPNKIKTPK